MSIKNRLQVILITYNRARCAESTFKQFFADNSPVQDIDFLVLDNNSNDNTAGIVRDWQKKFPNISYVKNKYNLGLSGNIARAMELANKDYVWIIGDDDRYDFSNWGEVERAIENNHKIICVSRYAIADSFKEDVGYQLLQLTFITGGIYKTDLFDDTTIKNALDNIYTLFPHICPAVKFLNGGGKFYIVNKAISDNGMDIEKTDVSYIRGAKSDEVYSRSQTMNWIVGYCNILSRLRDRKLKEHCIDVAIRSKSIFGSDENFYDFVSKNYLVKENFMHFIDIYINVSRLHAKKLKEIYTNSDVPKKCDLSVLSFVQVMSYLFKTQIFKKFIFNIERTTEKRYLTIFGIRIISNRKKHKK